MASARDNLLYRLRKKGVVVITKARTVVKAGIGGAWMTMRVKRWLAVSAAGAV